MICERCFKEADKILYGACMDCWHSGLQQIRNNQDYKPLTIEEAVNGVRQIKKLLEENLQGELGRVMTARDIADYIIEKFEIHNPTEPTQ